MQNELIFGPPGTGKTTQITGRVDEARAKGRSFTLCSYTRAAAAEILSRIGDEDGRAARTIHSLAYEHAGISKSQVVDAEKIDMFADEIGYELTGKRASENLLSINVGDLMLSFISLAESRMEPIDDLYLAVLPEMFSYRELEAFYNGYNKWKRKWGYVDFNDMLRLFIEEPIQYETDVLFVDEAQDLSTLQWACVDRIKRDVIIVAGDDDQAIHIWAGADPQGMERFKVNNGGIRVTVLDQSYRVPRAVQSLAGDVISRVQRRQEKIYRPRDEEGNVTRSTSIEWLIDDMMNGESWLLLYRNQSVRYEMEEVLVKYGIPYHSDNVRAKSRTHFTSQYADAIRGYELARKGLPLSRRQMNALKRVLPYGAKDEDGEPVIDVIRENDWRGVLEIPHEHYDYLQEQDLFKEPDVELCTIHSAKGREADNVVLLTSMGHATWEKMAYEYDDECRVWYVGATRARHNLHIVDNGLGFDI